MKLKWVSMVLISVLLSLAVLEIQPITMVGAEGTTEFDIFQVVDAVGTYFEITNSPYLNITLASTEMVHVTLESIPGLVSLLIESNSSATSTVLTFGGFEASTTYYRHQDGDFIESFTTDSSGGYTYTQDISQGHHIFIQENTSTLYIGSNYTFTHDIYETIVVTADNIVIDGNGYTLQGPGSGYGFYLTGGKSGVTITNTVIKGWSYGVGIVEIPFPPWPSVGNNIISGNTMSDNYCGIDFWYNGYNEVSGNIVSNNIGGGMSIRQSPYNMISNNLVSHNNWGIGITWPDSRYNTINGNIIISNYRFGLVFHANYNLVYHNDIIDNTIQAFDLDPTRDDYHHPDLLEGNYWSDYPGVDDGSGTGKHAIAGDGIGDTDIPWPGPGFDYYPFVKPLWYGIPATVDVDPDTLNLKSNGEFITAYIELPDGYDVADIDLATVVLTYNEFQLPAVTDPQYGFVTDPDSYLMDHDGDGILERMVKFDRIALRDYLGEADLPDGDKFYDVTLTVTGDLIDGTPFEGTDTVVVIRK